MPEFKHMHHSIDSKALLQVLRAQCALALSDGSRPPSVTRMHRKMFVRCISELCVYQNNRSENDKIRNKIKNKEKRKRDRSRKGRYQEECGMLALSYCDVSPLGRSTVLPWDLGISSLS